MLTVKVKRLRIAGVVPTKAKDWDAGWDLYAAEGWSMWHGNVRSFATGIALEIPPGHYAQVLARSSLAREGVSVLGGVIDSGYRGDVTVVLANNGGNIQHVAAGDRIAQFVILPVPDAVMVETDELSASRRGDQGFGSTGR